MATNIDAATDLINQIATTIVHDEAYLNVEWEALSLVATVQVHDDGSVVKMHGYTYCADNRIEATVPEDFETVADLFERLRTEMLRASPNDRVWQSALIQIRRETGKVSFFFELDDENRWAVKPDNYEAMREELRPA